MKNLNFYSRFIFQHGENPKNLSEKFRDNKENADGELKAQLLEEGNKNEALRDRIKRTFFNNIVEEMNSKLGGIGYEAKIYKKDEKNPLGNNPYNNNMIELKNGAMTYHINIDLEYSEDQEDVVSLKKIYLYRSESSNEYKEFDDTSELIEYFREKSRD